MLELDSLNYAGLQTGGEAPENIHFHSLNVQFEKRDLTNAVLRNVLVAGNDADCDFFLPEAIVQAITTRTVGRIRIKIEIDGASFRSETEMVEGHCPRAEAIFQFVEDLWNNFEAVKTIAIDDVQGHGGPLTFVSAHVQDVTVNCVCDGVEGVRFAIVACMPVLFVVVRP